MDKLILLATSILLLSTGFALAVYILIVKARPVHGNRTMKDDSNFLFLYSYLVFFSIFLLGIVFLSAVFYKSGHDAGSLASYIVFLQLGIFPFCTSFVNIYQMATHRKALYVSLGAALFGMTALVLSLILPHSPVLTFCCKLMTFFIWLSYAVFFIRNDRAQRRLSRPDRYVSQSSEVNFMLVLCTLMISFSFLQIVHKINDYAMILLLLFLNIMTPAYIVWRIIKVDFLRRDESFVKPVLKRLNDIVLPRGYDNSSIHKKLIDLFKVEKIYLSPDISLKEVAALLITNKSYLSKILNIDFKRNFRDLVNYYRIKEAVELFEKDNAISLKDLYGRSGFKNNASFINAFKLNIGTTPSEWCRKIRGRDL